MTGAVEAVGFIQRDRLVARGMVVAAARSPPRIAPVTRFHVRAESAAGERVSFDAGRGAPPGARAAPGSGRPRAGRRRPRPRADRAADRGRRARRSRPRREPHGAAHRVAPRSDARAGHRQGRQARGHHPDGDRAGRLPRGPRRHRAHHRSRGARALAPPPRALAARGQGGGQAERARGHPRDRPAAGARRVAGVAAAAGPRRVLLGGRDNRPRRDLARWRRRACERDRGTGGRLQRGRGGPASSRGQPRRRTRPAHPAHRHRRARWRSRSCSPATAIWARARDVRDPRPRGHHAPGLRPGRAGNRGRGLRSRRDRGARGQGGARPWPDARGALRPLDQRMPLRPRGRRLRLAAHRFRRLRRRVAGGRRADAPALVPARGVARARRSRRPGARWRRSRPGPCPFGPSATSSSSRSREAEKGPSAEVRRPRPPCHARETSDGRTFVCGPDMAPHSPYELRLACGLRAPPRIWTFLSLRRRERRVAKTTHGGSRAVSFARQRCRPDRWHTQLAVRNVVFPRLTPWHPDCSALRAGQ